MDAPKVIKLTPFQMPSDWPGHQLETGAPRGGRGWRGRLRLRPVRWDLATLYENLKLKYELRGQPVPRRWTLAHRFMAAVLTWGAR